MQFKRPVVLCILDGWGYRAEKDHNAIELAHTPHWDKLITTELTNMVKTSGADVGLPDGQMGNSEVGHMNIGAGRVVMQDLPRISQAAQEGAFLNNKAFQKLVDSAQNQNQVHVYVMLSDGGVHNHMDHGITFIKNLSQQGCKVVVHGIGDGRDVAPKSGQAFAKAFEEALEGIENVTFGSLIGRYFAMDRDNRWERVSQAYFASVEAEGEYKAGCFSEAFEAAYARGETDEFVKATVMEGYEGIKDGDSIAFTNFRADRAREILRAILVKDFDGFERPRYVRLAKALGFVEYSDDLASLMETMFFPEALNNILAEIISKKGLKQYHSAETEKYPHVTFFFNGGREEPFEGEDRFLVPSPKVATYDLQPEMSAYEVCDGLVNAIESQEYDFIVVNFANGDMVGHTGVEAAAVKACEAVDECVGRMVEAVRKVGGVAYITADHGNAEEMWDYETNGPHTAHTTNDVNGILVNAPSNIKGLKNGRLGDIAPSLLALLGVDKPSEMTGENFLITK